MRARRLRRLGQLPGAAAGPIPSNPVTKPTDQQPTLDAATSSPKTIATPTTTVVHSLDSQKSKLYVGSTELSHDDDRISEMDDIHHKQKHQKFSSDYEQQMKCAEKVNNNVQIIGED